MLEVRSGFPHVAAEIFTLNDLDVLQARGAGDGMTGVGKTMGEDSVFDDRPEDTIGEKGCAQGYVTGRNAFCCHDNVRGDVEHAFRCKHVSQPAECRHHFVGHVEYAVAPADLQGAPVVSVRRHDYPACSHDRLGEEAGDVLCPEFADFPFKFGNQRIAVFRFGRTLERPVNVGARHVVNQRCLIGCQVVKAGVITRDAGDGGGKIGASVVGIFAGNNQLFRWFPAGLEVIMGKTHGGIDRRGPPRGEKDMVQVRRRQLRQLRGQGGRRYG